MGRRPRARRAAHSAARARRPDRRAAGWAADPALSGRITLGDRRIGAGGGRPNGRREHGGGVRRVAACRASRRDGGGRSHEPGIGGGMKRLLNYFVRGLLLLAPLAITVFVCWKTFTTIDGWLGLQVRGVGFLVTIALITMFGFLAGGFLTRRFVGMLERLMQ